MNLTLLAFSVLLLSVKRLQCARQLKLSIKRQTMSYLRSQLFSVNCDI